MAITLSAYALLTLDEAKAAAGVGANFVEIDALTLYINAITTTVETAIGRGIVAREYTETWDGDGTNVYRTLQRPVLTGVSYTMTVTYDDDGNTVPSASVKVNCDFGIIYLDDGYIFEPGFQNCQIEYYAGWATIPDQLKLAASMILSRWWRVRDNSAESVGSISVEGQTLYFTQDQIPKEAQLLLCQYMIPRVG